MVTRSIIINQLPEVSNLGRKSIRGLVTLNGEVNIAGTLRVFNIDETLLPITMAIKVGDKKYIYPQITDAQNYSFKIVNAPNDSNITILLATTQNGAVQGLAMGQNAGSTGNVADLFEDLSQNELDDLIDKEMSQPETLSSDEDEEDEISQDEIPSTQPDEPQPNETGNFYSLIQPQLDELFEKFPHYKELEDMVENTEWVKVNYSQDGQHYILGKLYDGQVVTHLCYGIPASSRQTAPPSTLTDYCQWLPTNLNDPNGAGYWVMYQNAETGENIKM